MATNGFNQNELKIPYKTYVANGVKKLVGQIPESRRKALVEEITARANMFGCENKRALQLAMRHLAVEQKEGMDGKRI